MKSPKILYFVRGVMMTEEQRVEASRYGFKVQVRNLDHIGEFDTPEANVDGVMGEEIPEQYRDYPSAEEAIANFQKSITEAREDIADVSLATVGTTDPDKAPKTTGTTGKPGFNTNRVEDEGNRVIDPNALTLDELTKNVEQSGKAAGDIDNGEANRQVVDDSAKEEAGVKVDDGKNPAQAKKKETKEANAKTTGWNANN